MKKKEYVCGVVSIYRKYLDMILNGEKFEVEESDINTDHHSADLIGHQ